MRALPEARVLVEGGKGTEGVLEGNYKLNDEPWRCSCAEAKAAASQARKCRARRTQTMVPIRDLKCRRLSDKTAISCDYDKRQTSEGSVFKAPAALTQAARARNEK